jgi:hypothetical protein
MCSIIISQLKVGEKNVTQHPFDKFLFFVFFWFFLGRVCKSDKINGHYIFLSFQQLLSSSSSSSMNECQINYCSIYNTNQSMIISRPSRPSDSTIMK